jgi:hypothetical protein
MSALLWLDFVLAVIQKLPFLFGKYNPEFKVYFQFWKD